MSAENKFRSIAEGIVPHYPGEILKFSPSEIEEMRDEIEKALEALAAEKDGQIEKWRNDAYENALKAEKWMAEATHQATERDKNFAQIAADAALLDRIAVAVENEEPLDIVIITKLRERLKP